MEDAHILKLKEDLLKQETKLFYDKQSLLKAERTAIEEQYGVLKEEREILMQQNQLLRNQNQLLIDQENLSYKQKNEKGIEEIADCQKEIAKLKTLFFTKQLTIDEYTKIVQAYFDSLNTRLSGCDKATINKYSTATNSEVEFIKKYKQEQNTTEKVDDNKR